MESSQPGAALTAHIGLAKCCCATFCFGQYVASTGTLPRITFLNVRITGFPQSLRTSTPRWAGRERQGSITLLPGLSPGSHSWPVTFGGFLTLLSVVESRNNSIYFKQELNRYIFTIITQNYFSTGLNFLRNSYLPWNGVILLETALSSLRQSPWPG